MLSYILFVSPILLIIVAGALIRVRGNPVTAARRYFLFLIWTTIGSLGLILLNWMFPHPVLGYVFVLFPIVPGLTVLTLLHWREWSSLHSRAKTLILTAAILLVVLAILQFVLISLKSDGRQLESIFFGMALFSVSGFMLITWKWGNRYPFLPGGIAILYLTFFNITEMGSLSLPSESMPGWWNALGALAYLALPGFTIPVMATFTANALNLSPTSDESKLIAWRPIIGRLVFILVLLGYLLYTYRWLWLWDGIEDGIRWIFMMIVSGIAVVSSGLVITMCATGWRRWAGLLFALFVTGSIYLEGMTNFGLWNGISNYTVTEERAARIQQAIEDHKQAKGGYPAKLGELVPGELLRIPLPMIMPEQNWCYEGGPTYYRLGAVYREHWSSPYLSVRVFASAGNIPETGWICDEKLAEVMSQSNIFGPPPTPVPLPTSITSVQRVVVEPILQANSFSTGTWSPDGAYLVFGTTEYFMDEVEHVTIDLHFLDAKTGQICQPSQSKWTVQNSDGLREHSVWLPEGRFLYVTDAGEIVVFMPCVEGVDDLASRYPVTFTHAVASDAQNGRVLLKNDDAYWLLNAISLEVRKIADVPTESYRPWYDWSPGGERLAMSLMSGPEVEDEALLYIVDWVRGEVEEVIPLEGASDASLPIVEWLTRDELLVHGNTLTVLDFRSEPPGRTDVLQDIFLLDIAYPDDFSSMDSLPNPDGEGYSLGARVNHPRNQGVYLYISETGQVEVFQNDLDTLFFFPSGQWMQLPKWEDTPTYMDEYELVWMDTGKTDRLVVEGHTPRARPQMFPRYLPNRSQLVFSSSQGLSLVSLANGETIGFWELAGGEGLFLNVIPSPGEEALLVAADGVGLYYIPLTPGE